MLTRNLGRTGLKVTAFCLGGNTFGRMTDQPRSEAVLDAFVEAGGNFVDTSDSYSRGESENVLGRWMTARGNRARVVIATKVCSPMGDGPNDRGLSRQHILDGVEASLRRLQTDYLDLYQAHRDDPDTPLDETLRAFDDLVRQGKVRYLGASNYRSWRLAGALGESRYRGVARFESLQPKYNLMFRDEYERELEPLCQQEGVGVITYSSLGSGFFSGKYRPGQPLPTTPRAAGVERDYCNERGWAILDAVERVASDQGATVAQVALAWIVQRPGITAPIASATSPEQVRELVGCVDLKLDADAVAALDAASAWQPTG
jgi:aryl-alcohol dehydrogenase-like predicted oxidoreductase